MIPVIAVLYGTETFNSYELAFLLRNALVSRGYPIIFQSMDEFELKKLLEIKIIIVISSTFGNGDNPRNTKKFWRFLLQKKLPKGSFLEHLEFTTFGLGDSSYPRYNYFIRKLHARLAQLGAHEVSPRGEGDDQSPEGVEAFFKEWQDALLSVIEGKFRPTSTGITDHSLNVFNPVLILDNKLKRKTDHEIQGISNSRHNNGLRLAKLVANKRITSYDHFQDVRHITLEDNSNGLFYEPGDIVELYPSNDPKDVDNIIESQKWGNIADYPLLIENKLALEGGLVSPLTLRSLITHHIDLISVPRRSFFASVYEFAQDERERKRLEEFSKLEFSEDLYNYANRSKRSVLETVAEFFSLRIPPESILDVFPLLRPRLFSIASSQLQSPTTIDLCVAIVKYKTALHRIRTGICTNWLKDITEGTEIVYSIKKSDIYSNLKGQPLILIGPGTGIAPIRSILYDKISSGSKQDILLFTGNRSKYKDFLYGEELSTASNVCLYSSFSRDGVQPKYVQDALYLHKNEVYDYIMNKKGVVYLCGSSGKMPIQARMTIVKIIQEVGKLSQEQAEQELLKIENERKYLQETW